jgi:quercetin dioxygenase-like cupin family protein
LLPFGQCASCATGEAAEGDHRDAGHCDKTYHSPDSPCGPTVFPLAASAAEPNVTLLPGALLWGPAPDVLPPGAQLSVLVGDPGKEDQLYVVRLKLPAGYRIPAHTHPKDEHVTVISGAFHIGMGAKFDEGKATRLTAGGFAYAAKGMQHYVWVAEETIVQVHGLGPLDISYVNPADDPRKK